LNHRIGQDQLYGELSPQSIWFN